MGRSGDACAFCSRPAPTGSPVGWIGLAELGEVSVAIPTSGVVVCSIACAVRFLEGAPYRFLDKGES